MWTAPITWANGAVSAATMNTEVRDHLNWLKGFADLITNSTAADSGTATFLDIIRATAGDNALRARVTGDTHPRVAALSDGTVQWGSGSAGGDISLLRSAAGQLSVSAPSPSFRVQSTAADPYSEIAFTNSTGAIRGLLTFGTSTSERTSMFTATGAAGAEVSTLAWEVDPTLPGVFILPADTTGSETVRVRLATDTQPRFRILGSGRIDWGPGGTTLVDVGLQRSGVALLEAVGDIRTTTGLAGTKQKAGVFSDTDFAGVAFNGAIGVDSTNSRLYVRVGGVWKFAALT